ncbi:MAG: bifunctional oligoribonuclease/PAP phosphatase NrnA [Candidatus Omnitrophica bacterium]|nr:bifunctional oligoribonuclease/PAP phosphatase NrnA [Candidatus Omnitrophota bacterium]
MVKSEIIETIEKYNKYLIVSHVNPEGDSLGSQFALKGLLSKLGKESVIANEAEPAELYEFLDINDDIITDIKKKIDYKAIIALDCPVIKRVGRAKKFFKKDKILINIDHHISNTNFGDVNWVEPYTSSCGEMVYELYKAFNVPIDYRSALFLYVAIITDTGSFAYENTSSRTHAIVAELIDRGLKPNLIYQKLYENRTASEVKLLKDALSTIRFAKDEKIAYMYVTKSMLDRYNLDLDVTEGFVNYARSINGVKVAMIFLQNPSNEKRIGISFRSKGEVDVDKLASLFGGGGHKNASGCVLSGDLKKVIKKVVDTVTRSI